MVPCVRSIGSRRRPRFLSSPRRLFFFLSFSSCSFYSRLSSNTRRRRTKKTNGVLADFFRERARALLSTSRTHTHCSLLLLLLFSPFYSLSLAFVDGFFFLPPKACVRLPSIFYLFARFFPLHKQSWSGNSTWTKVHCRSKSSRCDINCVLRNRHYRKHCKSKSSLPLVLMRGFHSSHFTRHRSIMQPV